MRRNKKRGTLRRCSLLLLPLRGETYIKIKEGKYELALARSVGRVKKPELTKPWGDFLRKSTQ